MDLRPYHLPLRFALKNFALSLRFQNFAPRAAPGTNYYMDPLDRFLFHLFMFVALLGAVILTLGLPLTWLGIIS